MRRSLTAVALTVLALAVPSWGAATPLDPNPWLGRHVLNIPHRGGSNEFPEHTPFAYKESLALGADMLELDIYATSDGELVVMHDPTVDRTTNGSGRVDSKTLAEIKALDAAYDFGGSAHPFRGMATGAVPPPAGYTADDFKVPTLREVLAGFPDAFINIEIKHTLPEGSAAEAQVPVKLAALLKEFGRGTDTIVVAFVDHATEAFAVAAAAAGIDVSIATGTGETAMFWATAQQGGPGSPNPRYHAMQIPPVYLGLTVLTPEFVARAHANGLAVHVWDVEGVAAWKAAIGMGVDGIMTDYPGALQAVICELGVEYPAGSC